jgi:hypothetical protein
VLVAGLAQARGQVHQAGRDDQPLASIVRWAQVGRHRLRRCGPAARAMSAGSSRPLAGSITRPFLMRIIMLQASLPATMLITAMRTAMPKVTCGRITPAAVGHGGVDLDAAVDRARVHDDGVGLGQRSFSAVRPSS